VATAGEKLDTHLVKMDRDFATCLDAIDMDRRPGALPVADGNDLIQRLDDTCFVIDQQQSQHDGVFIDRCLELPQIHLAIALYRYRTNDIALTV